MNQTLPAQHQRERPGHQDDMRPQPQTQARWYRGSGKLAGRRALITGGDSGIGCAIAVLFAREDADVVIAYLDEHEDAAETKRLVEAEGRICHMIAGDLGDVGFCTELVEQAAARLGGLDLLVNNTGEQHVDTRLEDLTPEQLDRTFRTNVLSMFHVTRAALEHLGEGASIINTTARAAGPA